MLPNDSTDKSESPDHSLRHHVRSGGRPAERGRCHRSRRGSRGRSRRAAPLYDVMDPGALNDLVEHAQRGATDGTHLVWFTRGLDVGVRSDGESGSGTPLQPADDRRPSSAKMAASLRTPRHSCSSRKASGCSLTSSSSSMKKRCEPPSTSSRRLSKSSPRAAARFRRGRPGRRSRGSQRRHAGTAAAQTSRGGRRGGR